MTCYVYEFKLSSEFYDSLTVTRLKAGVETSFLLVEDFPGELYLLIYDVPGDLNLAVP